MSRDLPSLRCPICDRSFLESDPDVAMPFCSRRCKMIDAGHWLGESYGMPIEGEEDVRSKGEDE